MGLLHEGEPTDLRCWTTVAAEPDTRPIHTEEVNLRGRGAGRVRYCVKGQRQRQRQRQAGERIAAVCACVIKGLPASGSRDVQFSYWSSSGRQLVAPARHRSALPLLASEAAHARESMRPLYLNVDWQFQVQHDQNFICRRRP